MDLAQTFLFSLSHGLKDKQENELIFLMFLERKKTFIRGNNFHMPWCSARGTFTFCSFLVYNSFLQLLLLFTAKIRSDHYFVAHQKVILRRKTVIFRANKLNYKRRKNNLSRRNQILVSCFPLKLCLLRNFSQDHAALTRSWCALCIENMDF